MKAPFWFMIAMILLKLLLLIGYPLFAWLFIQHHAGQWQVQTITQSDCVVAWILFAALPTVFGFVAGRK